MRFVGQSTAADRGSATHCQLAFAGGRGVLHEEKLAGRLVRNNSEYTRKSSIKLLTVQIDRKSNLELHLWLCFCYHIVRLTALKNALTTPRSFRRPRKLVDDCIANIYA